MHCVHYFQVNCMTISDYNKKNCMQGLCNFIEIALAHCKLHGLTSNCTGSLQIAWVHLKLPGLKLHLLNCMVVTAYA